MARHEDLLDPIEKALLDLDRAERAGLFQRTPVSEERLVRISGGAGGTVFPIWAVRVVPVAASILLAIGVGSWMFQRELSRVRELRDRVSTVFVEDSTHMEWGAFYKSFTGPRAKQDQEFDIHDYDTDGDVDLADLSKYQVAVAHLP